MKSLIIYFFLVTILSNCGQSQGQKTESAPEKIDAITTDFQIPFDISQPIQSIKLPAVLTEISGLTYSLTTKRLLAVNDEQGIVYALDQETGSIVDQIKFGKSDDYEGIASHDGYIYITESNGNIKVIKEESKVKIIEFNDRLSAANDIEGICYDASSNTLLVAAKGNSATEGNTKNVKSIFTVNIDNGAVRKKPYIELNLKESYQSLSKQSSGGILGGIASVSRFSKAGPSGIAIDPLSNLIYLLSSNSKSLFVLDHKGNVKTVLLLDRKSHAQPEGITFDNEGNLFISNEGKGKQALLYKYQRVANR